MDTIKTILNAIFSISSALAKIGGSENKHSRVLDHINKRINQLFGLIDSKTEEE